MSSRKSCRRSNPEKGEPSAVQTNLSGHEVKRRKVSTQKALPLSGDRRVGKSTAVSVPVEDNIDPVEKLLSFSYINNDILSQLNEADGMGSESSNNAAPGSFVPSSYPNISSNFTKAIHESMRSYYSNFRKSQMEIHNDHSSFSVLTRPQQPERPVPANPATYKHQVPFLKNVNFNPTPSFGHHIDDYIHYDDDEPLSTDSEHEELPASKEVVSLPIPSLSGKMSFHYRQNDHLNLSLTDKTGEDSGGVYDGCKFMKQRSVISGKASEMIGTPNFLISEFLF